MKLSYLITCSTETDTLERLLSLVGNYVRNNPDDELVVVIDKDAKDNEKTKHILAGLAVQMGPEYMDKRVKIFEHPLDKDYGAHKNFGNSKCTGDWIFQIDGDELPHDTLLENIKAVIESNPTVELYWVGRVNDFIGVTEDDAKRWGWRLTPCPEYDNRPIVSWPDPQGRIYKNVPERIKWVHRLHECISGHTQYSILPYEVQWSLYHDKDIVTQNKTNERYMSTFTETENSGGTVHKK